MNVDHDNNNVRNNDDDDDDNNNDINKFILFLNKDVYPHE